MGMGNIWEWYQVDIGAIFEWFSNRVQGRYSYFSITDAWSVMVGNGITHQKKARSGGCCYVEWLEIYGCGITKHTETSSSVNKMLSSLGLIMNMTIDMYNEHENSAEEDLFQVRWHAFINLFEELGRGLFNSNDFEYDWWAALSTRERCMFRCINFNTDKGFDKILSPLWTYIRIRIIQWEEGRGRHARFFIKRPVGLCNASWDLGIECIAVYLKS